MRKSIETNISVLDAAYQRIKNVYATGAKVRISFSGGKDSICLLGLVYNLIRQGEIDPKQTVVSFIDEEAMYECIIENVMLWRKRMLMVGAEFEWYCMEYLHYNCLNSLTEDDSWVCWDRYNRDKWIRPMPKFAITSHPLFLPRQETYQSFCKKLENDCICLVGLRSAESHRRDEKMAKHAHAGKLPKTVNKVWPIHDWKDGDVYKFILDNGFELPEVYQYLWESGKPVNKLRVSQFFAIDTVSSLVKMNEYYPDLMARITRREPNAYMVALYWDSAMFHKSTATRRKTESVAKDETDYRAAFIDVCKHPEKYALTSHAAVKTLNQYRRYFLKNDYLMTNDVCKKMYEAVLGGDTKMRTLTAIGTQILSKYSKKEGV